MSANDEQLSRNEALANLTDEERAAIAEDELTEGQRAALKEIAEDGDDDDQDDDGEGSDDGSDDDGAGGDDDDDAGEQGAAAGDGEGEGEDDGQAAEASADEDDDEDDDFTPTYKFSLPDDFDDQVKALDEAEADIAAKFKAGDIEADEFIAENRKLGESRRALDAMRTKAEIATDMGTQTVEQQWTRKVVKFMAKPRDGIDYKEDEAARNDFDAALKMLGNNPAYNDKGFDWFIDMAHKMAMARREADAKPAKGKTPPKVEAGDKDKPKTDGKGKKPAPRKPAVDKLPANLANVPGGDGPGDVQDEFSDLDSLDGLEYERALAKMTPAQRERYLALA